MSKRPSRRGSLPVRVLASVFCEDVRTEVNGKDMLIGTYAGAMIVPALPVQISLGAWIAIESIGSPALQLEFRIRDIKKNFHQGVLVELIAAPQGLRAALAMRGRPFPLTEETALVLEIRQHDQDIWHTLNDIVVTRGPVPPSPHDIPAESP